MEDDKLKTFLIMKHGSIKKFYELWMCGAALEVSDAGMDIILEYINCDYERLARSSLSADKL